MSENDWKLDLESEKVPQSDDESRGRSDGAASSISSYSSENTEDRQLGSELLRPAGTKNLWLGEDHTTGDEVRRVLSKPGASRPDPSREESDSNRHADQALPSYCPTDTDLGGEMLRQSWGLL